MLVPLRVRDVMTKDVQTVTPGAVVAAAADRLQGTGVGSLLVIREGEPVGIVTTGDVTAVVAGHGSPETTRVADAMTPDPVTVDADTTVQGAVRVLREHGFEHLPVTEDGQVVGIVSTTDVAYALSRLEPRIRGPALPGGDDERSSGPEFVRAGSADGLSVGDVVRFTKTLSDEDVRAYAEASGDTNRLHLDDSFAEHTRFGRRIVHGTLLGGVVGAAMAHIPGLTTYLSQDVRFRAPVDVGATVTAVCEVIGDLGGNKYRLSTAVVDADGTRVTEGDAVVIVDELPPDVETEKHESFPE
jgi:CBS domain-containing protein/acyl dehydratase